MKMTIHDLRFTICRRRAKTSAKSGSATSCPPGGEVTVHHRPSSNVHRKSCEGVALVVTLILLSVTLVMAIAFLAISRRARNASSTSTDTASAQLAADSALAAAQAQIAASILATNAAAYDYHLLVSTNFVSTDPADYTSYFDPAGNLLSGLNLEQSVTNQWILPRPPVFVSTNAGSPLDFRYYLDLNRNGHFEDTGDQVPNVELNLSGNPYTNDFIPEIGDPQWIGVLEHPDQPHGPANHFVARYAFLAQPIGNSLDLNYIHNETLDTSLGPNDGYFCNQHIGSWELNLAAFLCDLNTNEWGQDVGASAIYYQYNRANNSANPLLAPPNYGHSFDDARALVAWRYNGNYTNLATGENSFLGANLYNYPYNIDGYSDGPLQTTVNFDASGKAAANQGDKLFYPFRWAGSDNPNRFYSLPSDLFDNAKTAEGVSPAVVAAGNYFTGRLKDSAARPSTYDRYTLYRLLGQMGTDSTAPENQMNLNFKNIVNGSVVPGMETNLIRWSAMDFFTNAADRMLRFYSAKWYAENPTNYLLTYYNITNFTSNLRADGYGLTNFPYFGITNEVPSFGLTNIPVYVNGRFYYSPAVNRLLQLAANMFDATTNRGNPYNPAIIDYPSVFRPMFTRLANGDIWIDGYQQIPENFNLSAGTQPLDAPMLDITNPLLNLNANWYDRRGNVYGVPWIIGAKKGLPNFNQFYMRNLVQVTRKLQVTRNNANVPGALATNQMFLMSITNRIGFSFWNSYTSNFPAIGSASIRVHFSDLVDMALTNQNGYSILSSSAYGNPAGQQFVFDYTTNRWPGANWNASPLGLDPTKQTADPNSFISGYWDFSFLPESQLKLSSPQGQFVPTAVSQWETSPGYVPPLPQFGLNTTNRIQAYILVNNHVVDYVQFDGPSGARNINSEISDTNFTTHTYWSTNRYNNADPLAPASGVVNQIVDSQHPTAIPQWKPAPDMPAFVNSKTLAAEYFASFFTGDPIYYKGRPEYNTNLSLQAPFTPTRYAWDLTLWQANDPLVHYLASDLKTYTRDTGQQRADDLVSSAFTDSNPQLNSATPRYQPWGRGSQMDTVQGVDRDHYNLAYRDPLVWNSDGWDFPEAKLPTVGWLGRVHRGTPWQTVYLKATNIYVFAGSQVDGAKTWANWTGDTQLVNNRGNLQYYDAGNSDPVQDRFLFTLFTARLNENAVRGSLSVNQPGLASWSAMLSGLVALTNTTVYPGVGIPAVYTNVVVQPAGPDGTNSALGWIVDGPVGINATRADYDKNSDGAKGVFEDPGDILRVPALTEQSPFLNWNNTRQQQYGISDQLYEWLPQQILGLVHVGSAPRYVVYCYGQTLRPAPNGTVLSGSNFNLVTNYQVTAESVARAVIRVDRHATATGTNYTTTVESYNVLPPD